MSGEGTKKQTNKHTEKWGKKCNTPKRIVVPYKKEEKKK